MFQPRLLLIPAVAFLLFSCESADKHNLPITPPSLTKDTIPAIQKKEIVISGTAKIIEKRLFALKSQKTSNTYSYITNRQAQTSLENDFKAIERKFQDFLINPNSDTTIFCKEGTILKIRPSSFLIASTSAEVTETIKFQVKEFYKISDIVSARLTTNSNGDILETGGMLFILATSNGELCELKDDSPIEISFPFTEKKEGMLLFNGEWTNDKINWELPTQIVTHLEKTVEESASFPGGSTALKNFLVKNLAYPDSLAIVGIGGTAELNFIIDETGKATDVNFRNLARKEFKDAILNTFSKMPRWNPAKRNGVPIKSTCSKVVNFYNEEGNMSDTIFQREFETKINEANINDVETNVIRKYIFNSSKLGWINCDRFYDSPKSRTEFYVDCGDYTELDIKLVFHSFKAILDNYASKTANKFQNIPEDEAITIVAVKKINNDTFISLTKSNTSLKSVNNLAFEKVTVQKLKQKLEQLNNIHRL
jgi:hypothetical protein